jgi:hypothetical protein
MDFNTLAQQFNAYMTDNGKYGYDLSPATEQSIQHIEQELGIRLPPSLIRFSQISKAFSSRWFARIGEDYDHPNHIINMNRLFQEPDEDSPKAALPDWFVMINLGHDGDFDGLDTRSRDPETGEYPVLYWCYDEGLDFVPGEPMTFVGHLEKHLKFWLDHKKYKGKKK